MFNLYVFFTDLFFDVNYFFSKNKIDIFLSCFLKISIYMDAFQFFSQDH